MMIRIKQKRLLLATLLYIYIPIVIFIFTWTKIYIAILFAIVLVACAFSKVRKPKGVNESVESNDDTGIPIGIFIFAILFLIIIGYYAGYGRFVDQVGDWQKHNAILYDLIKKSWPVYYTNGDEHSMLSYYIAQYIVPGLVGKVFHSFRVAEITLYVWNEIGLILIFLHIIQYLKMTNMIGQVMCTIAIPFFSIPLWLSQFVLKRLTGINTIGGSQWFYREEGGIQLQYSANFTMLSWVFPQVIVCWLSVMLLLEYKDKIRDYVLMLLPSLLYGTLSFLGILPLAIGYVVEKALKTKDIKIVREIFSFENIGAALTEGLIFLLYLYGNVIGPKPSNIGFHRMPYTGSTIILYLLFVGINVIIYSIILWKMHKTDGIFYATVLVLSILPFFTMGRYNDLVMRTSIPALFVLMIYILDYLKRKLEQQKRTIGENTGVILCLLLLMIGMYYPFLEFSNSAESETAYMGTGNEWKTLEDYANRSVNEYDDIKYNYYAYDIEDNLFYRYIAANKG